MSKYLSKDIILAAYKRMKDLTEDPSKQGQTQTVSVIRHAVALDAFGEIMKRNCDTAILADKRIFSDLVGDVVRVVDDLYTTNFYKGLKRSKDYNTGSNFYSAGVLALSKDNPDQTYQYPRRSNMPELFKVQNRLLLKDSIKHANILDYLHNPTLRCAFLVWLLRNSSFSDDACNDTFNIELQKAFEKSNYSISLRNVLWGKDYWTPSYLMSNTLSVFSDSFTHLDEEDIYNIWLKSDHKNDEFGSGINPIIMGEPRTLNIQYFNGNPLGIVLCTEPLNQITTLVIPRNCLADAKSISGIPRRGIYYLFNRTNSGIKEGYAGQTRQGVKRIIDHDATKDWWNVAIANFAPDQTLTLDVVNALENYAISQLNNSSIFCANKVGNLTQVGLTQLNIAKQVFKNIQFRMQALGYFVV